MTANTDTNPQVTPSPPSVVSPIKAYDYVDLTKKRKQQQNNMNMIDPPARSKNIDPPARPISGHRHNNMNVAAWYHIKQVFNFLVFSVVWTLLNFATGVGIRIINRLPTKISISIRVIKVVNWLYYFSAMLCIGFIRSRLNSKTIHVQNRYAR